MIQSCHGNLEPQWPFLSKRPPSNKSEFVSHQEGPLGRTMSTDKARAYKFIKLLFLWIKYSVSLADALS